MSDSAIPWTVVPQAPLSVGCSRQEYWGGLPFLSPGDLPDPGIEPTSFTLAGRFFSTEPSGKPCLWLREWFFRDNFLDDRWLTQFFSFNSTLTQRHIKRLYFPSLVNDTVIMVYVLDRTVTVLCAFLLNALVVSPCADGSLFQASTCASVARGAAGCDAAFSVRGCCESAEFHRPVRTSGLTAAPTSGLMCLIAGAY